MAFKETPLTCFERKLTTYPAQRYFFMVIAESFVNSECKADRLEIILKDYYDKMSETEQKKLISTYKEMTPAQRANPKSA